MHIFSFLIGLILTIYGFNQPYSTPTVINIIIGIICIIIGINPLINMSHEQAKWFPLTLIYYFLKYWYLIIPIIIGAIIVLTHYIWK